MEANETFEQTSIESIISKADAGDLPSQNHLGYLYYKGLGVKQDYEKAASWYQKAAKHGYTKRDRETLWDCCSRKHGWPTIATMGIPTHLGAPPTS